MKKILAIGGALAILFVGIVVGAVYGSARIASANSLDAAASTPTTNTYCTQFQQDLAKRLNISTSTLQQAEIAAADDMLAQMVKDGKLTQTQADQIKAKLANGIPCNMFGKGGHGRNGANGGAGKGGFGLGGPQLQSYMTAVEAKIAQGLGISTSTLTSDLQSGQTLHQIAAAHNVSDSQLESIIKSAVQSELSSAVSAGAITQTQANNISQQLNNSQFLSNLINRPLGQMGVHPNAPKGTGTPKATPSTGTPSTGTPSTETPSTSVNS